jgi:hypothetical protein
MEIVKQYKFYMECTVCKTEFNYSSWDRNVAGGLNCPSCGRYYYTSDVDKLTVVGPAISVNVPKRKPSGWRWWR